MEAPDAGVLSIAIENMDTGSFESFGQLALAQVLGIEFEPSGGVKDGGQDGFLRPKSGKPTQYIQISKEKDVRGKVRRTIMRLRESGRTLDHLTFLTSEYFPTRDVFEDDIEREFNVNVKIHDRTWVLLQVARDEKVLGLLLGRAGQAIRTTIAAAASSPQVHTPAERMSVLVYMDAHARSAPQETDLLTLAVDAAIYEALEGTDPDAGIFRSQSQIVEAVQARFPAVKNRPSLDIRVRLDRLSAKTNNPRIRKYEKEDKYCLPYDVRSELSDENLTLKRLELEFNESLKGRAWILGGASTEEVDFIARASAGAIVKTFEVQGMNLAASFEAVQSYTEVKTYDYVWEQVSGNIGDNSRHEELIKIISTIVSNVFYTGNDTERRYLLKLFKLYSTEFILNGDERVASHFRGVVSQLRLVVGTDVILRALSEVCLPPEAQATQNTLSYLRRAGAMLFLSEKILEEVYTHIIAEGKEFEAHYQPWLKHATLDEVKNSDRILMRAFFYSYFEPDRHAQRPRDWRSFLGLMGSPEWFDKRGNMEEFAVYLIKKFSFEFIKNADLLENIPGSEIQRLKNAIVARRQEMVARSGNEVLAENDAVAALYINRQREERSERYGTSVYGYRSWWLTEEFHVVQAAQSQKIPSRFGMHPQFLMNFCAVAPGLRDVNEQFGTFFPTNFGLRITDRMSEETLREFLNKANEAARSDDALAAARIRALSNDLQAQAYKGKGA